MQLLLTFSVLYFSISILKANIASVVLFTGMETILLFTKWVLTLQNPIETGVNILGNSDNKYLAAVRKPIILYSIVIAVTCPYKCNV